MSGHNKWASIKHKKAIVDAKRGKVFTKIIREITMGARMGGSDPATNPRLRTAIQAAKDANMPADNIERAIKKGAGELEGVTYEELTYEGYGPQGVAILVQTVTDNKNRSSAEIRSIFTKQNGTMAGAGSVAWMFDRKGLIILKKEGVDLDEAELAAIDGGAEDVQREDETLEIYTQPTDLNAVATKLKAAGFEIEKAELILIPNQIVKIDDEETAKKIMEFMEALDDDQDVSELTSNFDISD